MSRIIFVLGGIRSGKSLFAIKAAKERSKRKSVTYIATGLTTDKEMEARISAHKKSRPDGWQTIEEPTELEGAISQLKHRVVIVDCINFWVNNLLTKKYTQQKILSTIEAVLNLIRQKNIVVILVSNEVGLSLVAPYKSGRLFQETLGKVNQTISSYADEVYFIVSGIAMKLK